MTHMESKSSARSSFERSSGCRRRHDGMQSARHADSKACTPALLPKGVPERHQSALNRDANYEINYISRCNSANAGLLRLLHS